MEVKEIQEIVAKSNCSAWSCFRAGQIVQYFSDHSQVGIMSINVPEHENANEIQLVVSHCIPCDVKIERNEAGIVLTLTRHDLSTQERDEN